MEVAGLQLQSLYRPQLRCARLLCAHHVNCESSCTHCASLSGPLPPTASAWSCCQSDTTPKLTRQALLCASSSTCSGTCQICMLPGLGDQWVGTCQSKALGDNLGACLGSVDPRNPRSVNITAVDEGPVMKKRGAVPSACRCCVRRAHPVWCSLLSLHPTLPCPPMTALAGSQVLLTP